jgi:hypothetical protein
LKNQPLVIFGFQLVRSAVASRPPVASIAPE